VGQEVFLAQSLPLLCCVNPTLNIHPSSAPSFLEPSHFAKNSDAFTIRAMPDGEQRRAAD